MFTKAVVVRGVHLGHLSENNEQRLLVGRAYFFYISYSQRAQFILQNTNSMKRKRVVLF